MPEGYVLIASSFAEACELGTVKYHSPTPCPHCDSTVFHLATQKCRTCFPLRRPRRGNTWTPYARPKTT
jgi:ribosomal protein L37E